VEQREDADDDPLGFLTTGTWSGYRFALDDWYVDKKGIVAHYQASAVPVERGTTGFRAFWREPSFTSDGFGLLQKVIFKANCSWRSVLRVELIDPNPSPVVAELEVRMTFGLPHVG